MELWQEAYKAIEDIHGLMALSKKTPVPKTMANYYQKLAMVFSKAGNQLFHAAALLKLFQLTRELKKNLTKDDLQRMAAHVLLATLSIPLPSAHPEFDRFIEADKSPLEKALEHERLDDRLRVGIVPSLVPEHFLQSVQRPQRLAHLDELCGEKRRVVLRERSCGATAVLFGHRMENFQHTHHWLFSEHFPGVACSEPSSIA